MPYATLEQALNAASELVRENSGDYEDLLGRVKGSQFSRLIFERHGEGWTFYAEGVYVREVENEGGIHMLTPEQLEAAARKLCEIRRIDPDERCEDETRHDEFISTTIVYFAWEKCAEEIRAYLEIQEAIQNVPCECQSGRVTLHGRCANCKGSGLHFKPRI